MKVIYLHRPEVARIWCDAVFDVVGAKHDLTEWDRTKPLTPQFAEVEALLDLGGRASTREMFLAAPKLMLWQMIGVGYDAVDLSIADGTGVAIANCPGSTSAQGLAEGAMMFMLMLAHRFHEASQNFRDRIKYQPTGIELTDKVLGLIGFGASARVLASLAKPLGMRLMIVEPREIEPGVLAEFQPEYVGTPAAMDRIFREADFVSLHLPLTPETKGIVSAEKIAMMKPTACFINIARGDLVDQEALYSALLENRIAGIGTDVHAGKYPDSKHPVYQHPQFYTLPHVSGTTRGTVRRRSQICVDNLNHLASDEPLHHRIDQ